MPLIVPQMQFTGYDGGSSFSQSLARAAFIPQAAFTPATPYVINAGNSQDTDPMLVAGFNCFMLICNTGGAGTVSFSYNILDPQAAGNPVILNRSLKAAVAPGSGILVFFGAFTTGNVVDTSADVFISISLRFTANVAQMTIAAPQLWCGVR